MAKHTVGKIAEKAVCRSLFLTWVPN